MRFGVVASAYVNTMLKEGHPPISPGAWFGYEPAEPEVSDEQFLFMMQQFAAAHNARLGIVS